MGVVDYFVGRNPTDAGPGQLYGSSEFANSCVSVDWSGNPPTTQGATATVNVVNRPTVWLASRFPVTMSGASAATSITNIPWADIKPGDQVRCGNSATGGYTNKLTVMEVIDCGSLSYVNADVGSNMPDRWNVNPGAVAFTASAGTLAAQTGLGARVIRVNVPVNVTMAPTGVPTAATASNTTALQVQATLAESAFPVPLPGGTFAKVSNPKSWWRASQDAIMLSTPANTVIRTAGLGMEMAWGPLYVYPQALTSTQPPGKHSGAIEPVLYKPLTPQLAHPGTEFKLQLRDSGGCFKVTGIQLLGYHLKDVQEPGPQVDNSPVVVAQPYYQLRFKGVQGNIVSNISSLDGAFAILTTGDAILNADGSVSISRQAELPNALATLLPDPAIHMKELTLELTDKYGNPAYCTDAGFWLRVTSV